MEAGDQDDYEASSILGDLVDEELASTAQAIEAANQRIQEMLDKSREDDTGVKLEVNERLLDSCTNLMKAIQVLIGCSTDLQVEIVEEKMVSETGDSERTDREGEMLGDGKCDNDVNIVAS